MNHSPQRCARTEMQSAFFHGIMAAKSCRKEKSMPNLKPIQDALDYIESHIWENLTPETLCRESHYSLFHFCRLFEYATGMPVKQYILRRKLLWSAWLLARGESVTFCAVQCGFDTPAGFYKAFRREMGMPPSRFKARFSIRKPYPIQLKEVSSVMISMQKIRSILQKFGLQAAPVTPVIFEKSGAVSENAWWVGDRHVLKAYPTLGAVQMNARIANRLSQSGFDAPVHIPASDGSVCICEGELYFALTYRVPGHRLETLDMTCADARETGRAIARLHLCLKEEDPAICREKDVFEEVLSQWLLPASRALQLPDSFVRSYRDTVSHIAPHLPRQIIHRDPNPDNLIWRENSVVGFVDFDLSQLSVRIFDPCYAATAVLSEWMPRMDECEIRKRWPAIFRALMEGYDSISPLSDPEKEALPLMVLSNQLLCVGYFSTVHKYRDLFETNKRMTRLILSCMDELSLS